MTIEFWQLAYTISPLKLLLFFMVALPLLVRLSRIVGFEKTRTWFQDAVDAAFALVVGALVTVILLTCFGALSIDMSAREIIGKIAIESYPAAIGALLARAQFGSRSADAVEEEDESFGGKMFMMTVGALFLALNVAPTEEIILIAYRISAWQALALVLISLVIVHGFVFAVDFRGGSTIEPDAPWWIAFLQISLPGYVLALLVSAYLLWTFHTADVLPMGSHIFSTIVLGLPASVGAAAARLIL